jgi:hypothetical protein
MMLWKNRNKKIGLCVMILTSCFILATIWAVVATPETALAAKGGGGGGKGTFETVLYWVSFSQDPLNVFWPHQITGRIENPDDPRVLVNRVVGGEPVPIQPKNLRLDDDFAFVPGTGGGDDFDTAFPDTTYEGTLIISGDGTTVSKQLKDGLSRTGKKLHYQLTAAIDPLPGGWDPLGMSSGATVTISLGAWELKAPRGTAKGVHAWGNFDGQTQITIEKQ